MGREMESSEGLKPPTYKPPGPPSSSITVYNCSNSPSELQIFILEVLEHGGTATNNFWSQSLQVITPLRRRSRSFNHRSARLVTDSHKYDMVYSQEDKIMLENICTSVIQELAFFSTLLHQYNNDTEQNDAEQFGFLDEMNETNPNAEKKNETTKVEYVLPIAGDKVEKYSATMLQNRTQQVAAN